MDLHETWMEDGSLPRVDLLMWMRIKGQIQKQYDIFFLDFCHFLREQRMDLLDLVKIIRHIKVAGLN